MATRPIQAPPSSNIAEISYDDDSMTLYITFVRNNHRYSYAQVPANVATGFSTSGLRANAYFNQSILNQYPTQRLS